ncbi:hypothetical protein GW931_03380, partial [archaeon]|nr:hypothetical protein [archaeon]
MEEGENILENLQKDRKGLLYYIKKYFLFGMLILLIMIFFVLVFYMNDEKVTEVLSCGDGTFYSTCSLNKPYYCSDGILIKDAVSCGCPDALDKIDTTCTSNYYKEEINIPLNLNLRNEEKEINFKFYQKVLNYLDTLPKMIFYPVGEIPRRDDFKLMKIDDPIQREALMPLVTEIQNMAPDSTLDQARIAINLVQNIPYGEPEFASVFGGKYQVRLSKYPYQTLFDNRASCEGKSELLAFLLREIGYGVSLFYYAEEN